MHLSRGPQMRQGSTSSEFGGYPSNISTTSGTEHWGERPRGIDWTSHATPDNRGQFEQKRPGIQDRGQNWNADSQYQADNKNQHNNNPTMQEYNKQKAIDEKKEINNFIANIILKRQQMTNTHPMQQQMLQQQFQTSNLFRGVQLSHSDYLSQSSQMINNNPPSAHVNSPIFSTSAAANGGTNYFSNSQCEMPSYPFLSSGTAMKQYNSVLNPQQPQQQNIIQEKWNSNEYFPTPPEELLLQQISQKLKQASGMPQPAELSQVKQGATGLVMNNNSSNNYNPLMQQKPFQHNTPVASKDTISNIGGIDVDELRDQLISGELVVVRKELIETLSNKKEGSEEKNDQQRQIKHHQQTTYQYQTPINIDRPLDDVNKPRRQSSEDNVFQTTEVYRPPNRQQSFDGNHPASSSRASAAFYKSNGRRSRGDEDPDWRSRDNKVPVIRKLSFENQQYRRRKSTADEDPDWRHRSSDSNRSRTSSVDDSQNAVHRSPPPTSPTTFGNLHQVAKIDEASQNRVVNNTKPISPTNRDATKQQLVVTTAAADEKPKHVSAQSKRNIQNWIEVKKSKPFIQKPCRVRELSDIDPAVYIRNFKLGKDLDSKSQQQQPLDEIIKNLTIVEGNIDDSQLAVFMEKIQLNATTEEKLKSYADDLCNRAIAHPSFGYGASLLCHRMSYMMVEHGTKFRSMVFINMEKQFNSRDELFLESLSGTGNIKWFGFIHFLVHLYLNVRVPDTNKRFTVLVKPVYTCLLQVLKTNRATRNHAKCFGEMFRLSGLSLEEDDPNGMSELMSEIRDASLTSQDSAIRNVLLRCVRMYATKWLKHE